ncbi:hypothetical protein F7725_004843, partial [Dissostichus mawsoni]
MTITNPPIINLLLTAWTDLSSDRSLFALMSHGHGGGLLSSSVTRLCTRATLPSSLADRWHADTSSPSSSSRMPTECRDRSESCRSTEHIVKPQTSAKSPKTSSCRRGRAESLHTSLGSIVRLQKGMIYSQKQTPQVVKLYSGGPSPSGWRTAACSGSSEGGRWLETFGESCASCALIVFDCERALFSLLVERIHSAAGETAVKTARRHGAQQSGVSRGNLRREEEEKRDE